MTALKTKRSTHFLYLQLGIACCELLLIGEIGLL